MPVDTKPSVEAEAEDPTSGERSPLLLATSESLIIEEEPQITGSATVWQTVLNISKTCMGTGTLALPFAARQAGIWLNTLGLLAVAAWTIYAVERLCHCLELLPHHPKSRIPRDGTSTLGKVAFHALGSAGLVALDLIFAFLLLGIVVAYLDAALSFLRDTPFTTGSATLNAVGTAIAIGLLSNVPDMGYLAKASATGLIVLFLTFVVIACYGDFTGFSLNWWPENGLSGVSHWFGCVVFGFGTVPLTYNLRESMVEPQYMMVSAILGLTGTALAYILISTGILILYPDIEGDILQGLPTSSVLPTLVRLAMVTVVLMTAPLLVVPCSELIEGKVFGEETVTSFTRAGIRLSICILCAGITVFMPGFVYVLSFVGCCWCVLSFVFPPLVHIFLSLKRQRNDDLPASDRHEKRTMWETSIRSIWLDVVMLVWGCLATTVSSVYTFRALINKT